MVVHPPPHVHYRNAVSTEAKATKDITTMLFAASDPPEELPKTGFAGSAFVTSNTEMLFENELSTTPLHVTGHPYEAVMVSKLGTVLLSTCCTLVRFWARWQKSIAGSMIYPCCGPKP